MARYATVSALGPRGLTMDLTLSNAEIIRRMRAHWREQIERVLPDKPDLIVLPEVCDRPANYPTERLLAYYPERGDSVREEIVGLARSGNTNIAYSAVRLLPDGTRRNATEIIDRLGQSAGVYHKNHLTPPDHEKNGNLYGRKPELIALDFGTVAPIICFDLNYTELLEQIVPLKPDILAFSSLYHGGLMQAYWAYTARAHFVGAISGLPCPVLSPVGMQIACSTNYYARASARINLDCAVVHLDNNRERLEAARDRYGTGIRMDDPGYLGAVLLTCEQEGLAIRDILNEFGILTLDEYFASCRAHRMLPGRMES